ncbi:hypothetical protein HMPREF0534_1691, partial [Limosilactobacillus reuteri CF48-3A]
VFIYDIGDVTKIKFFLTFLEISPKNCMIVQINYFLGGLHRGNA